MKVERRGRGPVRSARTRARTSRSNSSRPAAVIVIAAILLISADFGTPAPICELTVRNRTLDFYIVTDLSASMGIPTNAAEQQLLIETNPDNSIERSSYPGGCQFACHYFGYTGFQYTQKHSIPLKLNDVGASIKALLTTANATKVITNQFRIGLYGYINNAVQLAELNSDFTSATSVANNLANYIDNGAINSGMSAGGTHFENIWSGIHSYFQTPGKGTTTLTPSHSSSSSLTAPTTAKLTPTAISAAAGPSCPTRPAPPASAPRPRPPATPSRSSSSPTIRSSTPSTSGMTKTSR